ncbi:MULTISPECIES: acyltransferase [unclassified Streptomyces]|uniref:acyltransferase family protein n=1 Tax=unclassified Streptomyces TaxID=2593676 RepID=UPI003369E73E
MRFLAALMVFSVHGSAVAVFRDGEVTADYYRWFSNAGPVGVSFFFILSGFVLTWSARPSDTTGRFWRRRIVKIFPNHLVTLAAALILMSLTSTAIAFPETLPNVFLLQAWVPDTAYVSTGNEVSWSLSVELFFYLSFPLLIKVIGRVSPRRLWYAAAGIAGLIVLVPVISRHLVSGYPPYPTLPVSYEQIYFVYVFPVCRLLEFVLGMLMARIVLTGRWIGLGVLPAALLGIVAYVGTIHIEHPALYDYGTPTVIPLALLIAAAAASDVKGRRTWLSSRPMVWLGEISFAFYLVHHMVLKYGHRAFGSQPNAFGQPSGPMWSTPVGILFLVGGLLVSVLVAWGLYALVERPAMRRWGRSPAAADVTAAATARTGA